jgi:hypothetical protein
MGEFRFMDEGKRIVQHIPTGGHFYIYPNAEVVEGTWSAGMCTPWGREYVLDDAKADVNRFLQVHGLVE